MLRHQTAPYEQYHTFASGDGAGRCSTPTSRSARILLNQFRSAGLYPRFQPKLINSAASSCADSAGDERVPGTTRSTAVIRVFGTGAVSASAGLMRPPSR
jgi:hypothetical protein